MHSNIYKSWSWTIYKCDRTYRKGWKEQIFLKIFQTESEKNDLTGLFHSHNGNSECSNADRGKVGTLQAKGCLRLSRNPVTCGCGTDSLAVRKSSSPLCCCDIIHGSLFILNCVQAGDALPPLRSSVWPRAVGCSFISVMQHLLPDSFSSQNMQIYLIWWVIVVII